MKSSSGEEEPNQPFFRQAIDILVRWWEFPTDGSGAAIFRIAFGIISIWSAIAVGVNLERYFSDDGMIPWRIVEHWQWAELTLFSYAPFSDAMLRAHFVVFLLASIMVTLGYWARPSALVIFIVNLSLQHRNGFIINSGDRLFLLMAAYAVCMPLTQRWSLHSYWAQRQKRASKQPKLVSGWGMRLMQLQIAYIYFATSFSKLNQTRWQNGHAMRDVLSSPLYSEWPVYVDFWPLVYAMTWGTLVFELGFPLTVWFKRLRLYVLCCGVLFHASIDILMTIPIFSAVMIVSYSAFLTDEDVDRILRRLRIRRDASPGQAPAPKKKKRPKPSSAVARLAPADGDYSSYRAE